MADRKITSNTALTGALLANNDVFQVVDVSDTTDGATGTNKKMLATEQAIGVIAQVAAGGIPYSKLTLTGAVLNADLAGSIAYSKLSLTGAVLNADLAGSIAYSKLSLTGAILNADLAGSIAESKITNLTTDLAAKAALAGPTFTGTVTMPAPASASEAARLQDTYTEVGINAQTGTTYTLVLGDAGKLITASNASAVTVSIPTNANVAFPIGTKIDLQALGAGQVTVNAVTAGTTTVQSTGASAIAPKLRVQHSGATLIKTGTDTWWVAGDLS